MAFPPAAPANDDTSAMEFRSMSDHDFARLSTEDKFRHIRLGMVELERTLAEWKPARPRSIA